jgi:hypothetical protein
VDFGNNGVRNRSVTVEVLNPDTQAVLERFTAADGPAQEYV